MKTLTNNFLLTTFGKHLLVMMGFITITLLMYSPLLQGKKLLQSDSVQYKGMSRQIQEEREKNNEELYWIDNAFGGMPTYQLGAKYPYDILTPIHKVVRWLPAPAFLLFLYFVGSYLFLLAFGFRLPYAVLGALAYGFSTYLLIIIQVGHNTKAQALGYMPVVLAAVHLLFTKNRRWGIFFAALALALQIRANHYQMTYYMLMLLGLYMIVQWWWAYRNHRWKETLSKSGSFLLAVVLALSLNATSLLATSEYTDFSTRGRSELTQQLDGTPIPAKTGLDFDYITQFSYGIFESLNLIVPRVQGGASREDLGTTSSLYATLVKGGVPPRQAQDFVANAPTYWGDQPILEAPAYVGVVVVFLAFVTLFFPRSRWVYWLYAGVFFSLLLSWGKNFSMLTRLFVDYFPLYNKFRAVSSIQVILEFCLPVLAMMGLQQLLSGEKKSAWSKLLKAAGYSLGALVLLYIAQFGLSFSGPNDGYYASIFGPELMQEVVAARQEIFVVDVQRAMVFIVIVAGFLGLYLKNRLRYSIAFAGVALLLIIDLLQISHRYLNRDLFVSPRQWNQSITTYAADRQIQQDSTYFRVYEPQLGLQGARTAFHHNAIGGYHGAKPRRFETFIELLQSQKANQLLDVLNVKYFLFQGEEGAPRAYQNPKNLGSAWMVERLEKKETPDEVYQSLLSTDLRTTALLEGIHADIPTYYTVDSLATVTLVKTHPEQKVYAIDTPNEAFVVFSEMYYPNGWSARLNEQETTIYPVDFILRGVYIPPGKHTLVFTFQPKVIATGSNIQLLGIGLLLLIFLLAIRNTLKPKAPWA